MRDRFAGTPSQMLREWRPSLQDGDVPVPCDGCVACCVSDLPVRLREDELDRFAHEMQPDGHAVLPKRGRVCALFDEEQRRCTVYATRPLACRTYDCRPIWLSGLRNLQRGQEINARLDEWRTQVHNDGDLGILAIIWMVARDAIKVYDVGMAASIGVVHAMMASEEELAALGRKARRGGVQHLLRTLNAPAGNPPPEETDVC